MDPRSHSFENSGIEDKIKDLKLIRIRHKLTEND